MGNLDDTAPMCSICGQPVALLIAHCAGCQLAQCHMQACKDAQDLLCKGEHVHADGSCLQCKGDLHEIECPSEADDSAYTIQWEPCVVDPEGRIV